MLRGSGFTFACIGDFVSYLNISREAIQRVINLKMPGRFVRRLTRSTTTTLLAPHLTQRPWNRTLLGLPTSNPSLVHRPVIIPEPCHTWLWPGNKWFSVTPSAFFTLFVRRVQSIFCQVPIVWYTTRFELLKKVFAVWKRAETFSIFTSCFYLHFQNVFKINR